MRQIALVFQLHLRLNALLSLGECETVAVHQPCDLNVLLGRHTDDLMNVVNETRVHLEQQRQLEYDKVLPEKEILEDLFVDCPMNDGMRELIELATLLDIVEYDLA